MRRTGVVWLLVVLVPGLGGAQDQAGLGKEDARLNQMYQQRVGQVRANAGALAELRRGERDWIRQRDQQCAKDVGCLTQATKARADYLATQVQQNSATAAVGAPIPEELRGVWVIRKELPTKTISCWDEKQAKALLGTELEYAADGMRWKSTRVKSLGSTTTTVTAKDFATDNSGGGPTDSQVDFGQLGIQAATVKQVAIRHPDVTIADGSAGGSMDMPGDTVMLKGPDALVFSVCNVYFEARRAGK